jgi:hypothetical protein
MDAVDLEVNIHHFAHEAVIFHVDFLFLFGLYPSAVETSLKSLKITMFPRMDRPSSSCRNGDIYFVESNRELIFI